uniref:Protein CHUP1, chloroplastic n=1 Tax=Musa acuminata subsp. malaccensis TaxID=214687 RepID=A0A804KYT6_MUSAM
MVAGKVKAAMGFQRSPATPKAETPRRSSSSPASHHKPSAASAGGHQPPPPPPPSSNGKASASFARSFGVYFPRASAQLLEQKLLKETVAIVPFLEKEIAARGEELARAAEKIERLEAENRALRDEVETLSSKMRSGEEESRRREKRIRDLETELGELKKALVAASVRRVPEVVEFYHSLMRRDSKREPGGVAPDVAPASSAAAANARDMIGEIENRSAHLLAIKTDVETQGDFIRFLIKEVEHAAFTNVEDVVAFVKWLDDELSFLVDERAVLKHFEWPEHKADAMREAAFGYCDLKKLVSEASSFRDDPRQPCASALKKMQTLLEKLEQGVFNLSRVREGATKRYRGFGIPWEWMLESGYVNQIKLASVKLAMKYMKRVSSELENIAGSPEEEELMLQGVRFAFRVHQFAGGFDVETMRAFQELKDKAHSLRLQSPHHHHHKLYCRSTSR